MVWKGHVSAPREVHPTILSTCLPPLWQYSPARASCGAWHCLLPPPGLLGWAGRWGPRSWRLGDTGEEEHRSVGLASPWGKGPGVKNMNSGAGQTRVQILLPDFGASAPLSVKWEE